MSQRPLGQKGRKAVQQVKRNRRNRPCRVHDEFARANHRRVMARGNRAYRTIRRIMDTVWCGLIPVSVGGFESTEAATLAYLTSHGWTREARSYTHALATLAMVRDHASAYALNCEATR